MYRELIFRKRGKFRLLGEQIKSLRNKQLYITIKLNFKITPNNIVYCEDLGVEMSKGQSLLVSA